MSFSLTVLDGSGAVATLEGSHSYPVRDALMIRVDARDDQFNLCRRDTDLLVNFHDGETVHLVDFFRESFTPRLYARGAEGDSYTRHVIPDQGDTCQGGLLPMPDLSGDTLGKVEFILELPMEGLGESLLNLARTDHLDLAELFPETKLDAVFVQDDGFPVLDQTTDIFGELLQINGILIA